MFTPRAALTCLAGLCALTAGCRSTSTAGAVFPHNETAVVMDKPAVQPQVVLERGTEVQWQAQTAQDQPGQVKNGSGVVGPDGTMVVGPYGTCRVAGLTLNQATAALESHLAVYMNTPSVRLSATVPSTENVPSNDMNLAWRPSRTAGQSALVRVSPAGPSGTVVNTSSDSGIQPVSLRSASAGAEPAAPVDGKAYYVVTEGDGQGEQTIRLSLTGNEKVLDAMRQINGFSPVSSKSRIWVARPSPSGSGPDTILNVDWIGISKRGATETNYQIMPGDRIYIRAERRRTLDSMFAKVLAPFAGLHGPTSSSSGAR